MATVSITIPDAVASRVVNALCAAAGTPATAANAKAALIAYIKQTVFNVEQGQMMAAQAQPAPDMSAITLS